jgi:hypothetical protein
MPAERRFWYRRAGDSMTDSDNENRRASDVPLDLVKERELFVRSFLRKGVELTEELLHENEELRHELERLRDENTRLRTQVASDDAMRDFMKKIEALETEKNQLLARSTELEEVKESEASRFEEIERELNDLANLYIAAYQLHASLSVRRVVRHVLDMLGQLVGAHAFAIYVLEPDGRSATPIAYENLDPRTLVPIPVGEGPIGEACLTGLTRVSDEVRAGSVDDPMAVIPMIVADRPVGAIAIVSMLSQKSGWASVDSELFKLLGAHAGSAIVAANLYAGVEGPLSALSDLRVNLERRSGSLVPASDTE